MILLGSAVAAVTLEGDVEMTAATTTRTEAMPAIAGKKRLAEREFMALPALPGSQAIVQPFGEGIWLCGAVVRGGSLLKKSYSRGCGAMQNWPEVRLG